MRAIDFGPQTTDPVIISDTKCLASSQNIGSFFEEYEP